MSSRNESRRSSQSSRPKRAAKRINWKLVVALFVVPLLVSGLGFLSFRYFRDRNLQTLWELAQSERASGKLDGAISKAQLYLSQRPDDAKVLQEVAGWFSTGALSVGQTGPVYRAVTEAARRDPKNTELAQTGFDLAMQLVEESRAEARTGIYTEARQIHFASMGQEQRIKPENLVLLAQCHAGLGETDKAAAELLGVIESGYRGDRPFLDLAELVNLSNPAKGEPSQELNPENRRTILRVFGAEKVANVQGDSAWTPAQRRRVTEKILERMEERVEPHWRGVLAQSRWAARRGDLTRAETLGQQAVRQSDRSAECLLWLIQVELQEAVEAEKQKRFLPAENHRAAARELSAQGVEIHPKDPRFPYQLGLQQMAMGQSSTARSQFRECLKRVVETVEDPNAPRTKKREAEMMRIPARIQLAYAMISELPTDDPEKSARIEQDVEEILKELDRRGIYGPAMIGRAQKLMVDKKWEDASKEWNVIANDPQFDPWSQMATAMLMTCLEEQEDWTELGKVSEKARERWPGWGPGERSYERYLRESKQDAKLQELIGRRKQADPLLVVRDRIRQELQKDKGSRDFDSIESELDKLVTDPDLAGDLRLTQLRLLVLNAKGENNRIHDLLQVLQSNSPRVVDLMVERVDFELRRKDVPLPRRIQAATAAIDIFRNAFAAVPQLGSEIAGPESRLMRAIGADSAPLASLPRAMILELAGEQAEAQQEFEKALQASDGRGLVVQKITDYCMRHELEPKLLNDRFLGVLVSTLVRIPPESGRPRAIAALLEWKRRETLPPEQQLQLARLLVATGAADRGQEEYEDLLKKSSRNPLVVLDYASFLSNLKEPTQAQKSRLADLLKQVEILRPKSLELQLLQSRALAQSGDLKGAAGILEEFSQRLDSVGTGALLRSLAIFGRADNVVSRQIDKDAGDLRDLARKLVGDQSPLLPEDDYKVLTASPGLADAVAEETLLLLAESLGAQQQVDTAERLLREQWVARKSAILGLGLATVIGREGKAEEPSALWKQYAKSHPDATARSIQLTLQPSTKGAALRPEVEKFLMEFAADEELDVTHAPLLLLLAEFKTTPDSIPAAISIYERLLKLAPTSPVALNNLAYVESFSDDRREKALEHISKAIDLDSPRLEYIDTRAVALLQLGRFDEARQDLERITPLLPSPLYYLHLAVAQYRLKNEPMAKAALQKCRELKLNPAQLPPLEILWFNEVRALYETLEDEPVTSGD